MRLIDADKLILHLNDYALQEAPFGYNDSKCQKEIYETIQECMKAVEEQPTAFDVEQHGEKLMEIYKLFKIDGSLKRNLTAKEMVAVYHIVDVLRGGRNEE